MSSAIWILTENEEDSDWDLGLILKNEKQIDQVLAAANLGELKDYLDDSILLEEFDVEGEPRCFEAALMCKLFSVLTTQCKELDEATLVQKDYLIEELDYCLEKADTALKDGNQIRLTVLP